MKLYRFTASDQHRAMMKAQEVLGPDALVYVTRKIHNGIEVLAGIEDGSSVKMDHTNASTTQELEFDGKTFDHKILENLNHQLLLMNKNIIHLTAHIGFLRRVSAKRSAFWRIITLRPFFDLFRKNKQSVVQDEDEYGTQRI